MPRNRQANGERKCFQEMMLEELHFYTEKTYKSSQQPQPT